MKRSNTRAGQKDHTGSTLSVAFHVTHNCNLRCTYCYTGEKSSASMTKDVARQGIDFSLKEAARQGVDLLEIVFFGGEPLLEKQLIYDIVDEFNASAHDFDIAFQMSTNATLLSEQIIKELAERRVYVAVSIDGSPAVQNRQRPDAQGGSSSEQIEGITKTLLEFNPCTSVTTVITPWSAEQMDKSVQWLFRNGFAYISTTLDYAADWSQADFGRLKKAYERLADWYVDVTQKGTRVYLSCFDERIRTRTRGPLTDNEKCSMGYHHFSIAPSGQIYPCVQFVQNDTCHEHVIGNVATGFTGQRRKILECSQREKKECKGCALDSRCAHWCSCVNWQSTGKIDSVSPVLCQHEKILIPIADKIGNTLWKQRSSLFIHKHYNPAFPVLDFIEDMVIKEANNEFSQSDA
jgi:uncharacterized protein